MIKKNSLVVAELNNLIGLYYIGWEYIDLDTAK